MTKAFGGALSLLLTLLVLRLALPQAADLLTEIIMKVLALLNGAIDHASTASLQF